MYTEFCHFCDTETPHKYDGTCKSCGGKDFFACRVCGERIHTDNEDDHVVGICEDCQDSTWMEHI